MLCVPFATRNYPQRGPAAMCFWINCHEVHLGGRYVVEVDRRIHSEVSDHTYPSVYHSTLVTLFDIVGTVAQIVAFTDVYSDSSNPSRAVAHFLRADRLRRLWNPRIGSFSLIGRAGDDELTIDRLTLVGYVDQDTARYFDEHPAEGRASG